MKVKKYTQENEVHVNSERDNSERERKGKKERERESQQPLLLVGDALPREINALPPQFVRVNNGGHASNDIAINLSANVSFYQKVVN